MLTGWPQRGFFTDIKPPELIVCQEKRRSGLMNTGTIATVVPVLSPIGGIARSTLGVSRGLAELGWDVHCVFQESGPLEKEWAAFATMHEFPQLKISYRSPIGLLKTLGAMHRVNLPRSAVIYSHNIPNHEFAWLFARVKRGRLAIHLRGDAVSIGRRLKKAVIAADARIAVSESTREFWRSRHGVDDVAVVPNGIELSQFSSVAPRRTTPNDPLRVLFLGRTEPEKGLETAVRAFGQARAALPAGSTLRIVGSSRSKQHLDWAARLVASAGDDVFATGVSNDVAEVLSECDVLFMPSKSEAFGRAAVEAMAAGIPVIGSQVGGLGEVLQGVRSNRLAPPGDIDEFARHLVSVSANRPLAATDEAELRARADKFAIETCVARIDMLLRERYPSQIGKKIR